MTVSAGAPVITAFGYWDTQSGDPSTAPGSAKYQADNWAAPALLAISTTDKDGYTRNLASLLPGDTILQLATNNSQNYQEWTVVTVTDHGSWVQLAVEVAASGSAFTAPGMNQTRLLQALRADTGAPPEEPGVSWQMWAPPLDPPVAGGLPLDTAQAIADAFWAESPHLCAALQWEAYAATLPPTPVVAAVSTGAQSVSYSPAAPTGDYGLAVARAAWHRSFIRDELVSVPLIASHRPSDYGAAGLAGWWVSG